MDFLYGFFSLQSAFFPLRLVLLYLVMFRENVLSGAIVAAAAVAAAACSGQKNGRIVLFG